MKCVLACLLGWLAAAPAARAGYLVYSPWGAMPPFIQKMPTAVPEPHVLPVGMHDARHPFTRPVARLDGEPVRRALFPSVVVDPVDRALVLRDYQKNGFVLTPFEANGAFKRYQNIQFHGIDALRDLRLREEKATLEDYRRYVAEEVKINAMLYTNGKLASTQAECDAMLRNYLAHLRRQAVIEKLPA